MLRHNRVGADLHLADDQTKHTLPIGNGKAMGCGLAAGETPSKLSASWRYRSAFASWASSAPI